MEKDKLFDCRNSSSIFYKMMKKYHQRNKNPILSNKGYIAYAIEQKRQKLQLQQISLLIKAIKILLINLKIIYLKK